MGRTVEIDEEELLRTYKLRDTVQKILAHPVAKLRVQEATKLVFPNAVTPELDNALAARNRDTGIAKELDDLKQTIATDKADRERQAHLAKIGSEFEAGFDRLRRERGYTDAGVAEVRKMMEDKGILDHEIAADHWDKQHPPQMPISPNGRGGAWNFMETNPGAEKDPQQEFVDKLIATQGKNDNLIDKRAFETLTEVRANTRR